MHHLRYVLPSSGLQELLRGHWLQTLVIDPLIDGVTG
jgi:hypothetical protein